MNPPIPTGTVLIRFPSNQVPSKEIERLFYDLNESLREIAIEEASYICDNARIDNIIRDAALYRISSEDTVFFYVQAVKVGSIEVYATIAATAYFVLDKTIAESIRSGYSKSDLHSKIENFIEDSLNNTVPKLMKRLRDHWRIKLIEWSIGDDRRSASITIEPRHTQLPTSIADLSAKNKLE